MDSVHRQGPVPDHRPSQGHHHHNQTADQPSNTPGPLDSAGYNHHQYSNSNNGVSNDDFNTFFNVPNDDTPGQSFNHHPSWDSTMLDPRLQHTSFGTQAWNQNSLNNSSSMATTPGQGITPSDYSNQFSQNHPPFNFGPFNNPQYQNFQGRYGQAVPYGGNPMMAGHGYGGVDPRSYGTLAGETIAPSALTSYSHLYNQSDRQMLSQSPSVTQKVIAGSHPGVNGVKPRRRVYDENVAASLANAVPAGIVQGNMLVKDPEAVKRATNSKQISRYVFVGTETMDSDDPRGTIPKVPARKSLSELKGTVLELQKGRPWDPAQRPLLKKLKMSSKVQKMLPAVSTLGTQPPSPSSSEDASSSDDDSEEGSDYDDGEDEKSPLPSTRPNDPAKAMEYDVIKILWFKHSMRLGGSTIRGALGSYWELIKPVRDAWKAEYSAISEAEAKNDKVKAERHRTAASRYRIILESAFQATSQYGHSDLVEKLSENPNLFLSFYQLLVDRFKEGDVIGNTVTSILSLMVRCTSMNQALFEKTKIDKILPRLGKKGNENTQKMVQRITELVKANGVREASSITVKQAKPMEPKSTVTVKPVADNTSGLKRAREPETAPSIKTVSVVKSKTPNSTVNGKVGQSVAKFGSNATKTPLIKNEAKSGMSSEVQSTAPKVKAAVPPKPASLFSGLQSASKKPGTSLAAQKANPPPEAKIVKPTEPKKPAQPASNSKASFSFAETMANLDKPRETGPVKKVEEQRPPETEEQKVKRLRKESRRHLRVSWRPEPTLVEVRLFKHDPVEELRHDSNMIRDVSDVKNEGQMLRLHKDLDLDDEDDGMEETELAPWHPLASIDFNELPDEAKADNYFSHGGSRQPQSPEKTLQEQHERTTLIAIYTSKTDIPPSPREPIDPFTGPYQEEKPFGVGEDDNWQKIKVRESGFFAAQTPRSIPSIPNFQSSGSTPTTDIHTLLKILGGGSQTQPSQPTYQPPVAPLAQQQTASQQLPGSLESIFAQFKTPQTQAPAPAPGLDPQVQKALETFNQLQHFQPQQQVQPQQMYQPQAPVEQQQTPDLSALLAQLGSSAMPGMSQQSAYNYQPSFGNDNDRKRSYDNVNQNSNQYNDYKRARGNNVKKVRPSNFPIDRKKKLTSHSHTPGLSIPVNFIKTANARREASAPSCMSSHEFFPSTTAYARCF